MLNCAASWLVDYPKPIAMCSSDGCATGGAGEAVSTARLAASSGREATGRRSSGAFCSCRSPVSEMGLPARRGISASQHSFTHEEIPVSIALNEEDKKVSAKAKIKVAKTEVQIRAAEHAVRRDCFAAFNTGSSSSRDKARTKAS